LVDWSHASLSLLLESFILVPMLNCPSQQLMLVTSRLLQRKKQHLFCSHFLCVWRLQFISNISLRFKCFGLSTFPQGPCFHPFSWKQWKPHSPLFLSACMCY